MTSQARIVHLGTRRSALARWQTDHVADLLRQAWPGVQTEVRVITTRGDRVLDTPLPQLGGKGLFTAELERALNDGDIDIAVHSLKDLPTAPSQGLMIGAIPQRADPSDVLISRDGHPLKGLPEGATIGTSSLRRAAQLLNIRPDLNIIDIRGNVETRISKTLDVDGPYDATVLARAGIERLGRLGDACEVLPLEIILPAPGQGALGIQCRDDEESQALLEPIIHQPTQLAVTAERAFLSALGGGCAVPVAAYAHTDGNQLYMRGRVVTVDGSHKIDVSGTTDLAPHATSNLEDAEQLGRSLAQEAKERGATQVLENIV